jgi:hypothetical protein
VLELTPESSLALFPTILLRSVPQQDLYYVFDVASGDQFRVNRTSYWILETIGCGILWRDLLVRFSDAFDISPDDGLADLSNAIDQFLTEGIIGRNECGEEGHQEGSL